MRKTIAIALFSVLVMGMNFGCDRNKTDGTSADRATAASKDDCPMCPGVQTAKADGTCPKCGMRPQS